MNRDAPEYQAVMAAVLRGALPAPVLHVDEWSEEFMVLPRDSPTPGRYRIARTPMARRILQCLSPRHKARRVVVMGASQLLKTQVAINFLMARAHRAPGNMLVLEPTDSLAKRLSSRIQKTIRDVPVLQEVFAAPRARDKRNSTFAKDFIGGTMHIATAGSAANLSELSAPIIVIDEVDRLQASVKGEGDPVGLAEARATGFDVDAKFLEVSSPLLAGASKIAELYDMGTQEVYLVPCPDCGHHHELVLANFHYARDPVSGHMARAWFVCPACGVEIDERHKGRMLRDEVDGGTAHWFARSLGDGETVSFHVSAFCAPLGSISWLRLARQHAHALDQMQKGNPNEMQVFCNTRMAVPWDNAEVRSTVQDLQARQREESLPPRMVPDRALVVTIAVDTQGDRLEVQAEAWGPGLERWVIDYAVLRGSPAADPGDKDSCWQQLDAYRRVAFEHASGILIPASVYLIDSGGGNTQDVYNYGAARAGAGCVIIRGQSKPNRPIIAAAPSKVDIDYNGQRIEGGALLWTVGSDVAKDHIFNRLALVDGPGAMHFAGTLPERWFEGFLGERPVLKRGPAGRMRRVWDQTVARNEPLDLSAYNLAGAHFLGLHRWAENDWAQLRVRLLRNAPAASLAVEKPEAGAPAPVQAVNAAPALSDAPVARSAAPAAAAAGRRILNRGHQ